MVVSLMDKNEQRERLEAAKTECLLRMRSYLVKGFTPQNEGSGNVISNIFQNLNTTTSYSNSSDGSSMSNDDGVGPPMSFMSPPSFGNATIRGKITLPSFSKSKCGMAWDDVLCWDEAEAGTLQTQACPDYVHGLDPTALASRLCTKDGTWYINPGTNESWTNFTNCVDRSTGDFWTSRDRLNLIRTIGYGLSLCSLIIAVLIMCCSRRLKSKSNTLHVNLFLAFILRAALSFTIRMLFVQDLGLEKDVNMTVEGHLEFVEEGVHWECRLLMSLFMYSICVSQIWIFVEGLYLHMLIYRTLSTERNGVRFYIALGWLLPFGIVIPWALVKAIFDNKYCWNFTSNVGFLLIIHGPLFTTVLVNFAFFLNIARVLCSRVRSSQLHMGRAKYKRLAKFILVLIPLFGVFYIGMTLALPMTYADRFDLAHMYIEMTYNSFQGFLLALLFCFLNEEVHSEIKRIWWRRRTRRRDSVATRSFVLSSFKRGSYHHNRATQPLSPHPATPTERSPRFSSRSSSLDAASQRGAWPSRLKSRLIGLLGQGHGRRSQRTGNGIVKQRSSSPPFTIKDDLPTEREELQPEELELTPSR